MVQSDEISWDLSVIFSGCDDPRIDTILNNAVTEAEAIRNDYKEKINYQTTTPDNLVTLLKRLEQLYLDLAEVRLYTEALLKANSIDKEASILSNRYKEIENRINVRLTFAYREIAELLIDRSKSFLSNPNLSSYKYRLERILQDYTHKLSDKEEHLIISKNENGMLEWSKLQSKWLSSRKFTAKINGEEKVISWGESQKYFSDVNRILRKEVMSKVLGDLGKDAELYATCLRNICIDHLKNIKLRKYSSPIEPSLIENEITQEIFDCALAVVDNNIDLFQDFLRLKAKILGTDRLLGEDLIAPLPEEADHPPITWKETEELICKIFFDFDPEFGSIAENKFQMRRIDASPRLGKSSGAFCLGWYKENSSFIILNFVQRTMDAAMLSHELGHSIHGKLARQNQNYLFLHPSIPFYKPSLILIETASEFMVSLFTEKLVSQTNNKKLKRIFLFKRLEWIMTIIFEVASRLCFEMSLYTTLEKGEYLSPEKISNLFSNARAKYFGDAIVFLPEQNYEWTWKSHYYHKLVRFYNYPYILSELFVLSLYNKYSEEGKSFIPAFKRFLKECGLKSATDLTKNLGIVLADKSFWEKGILEVKRLFHEVQSLYEELT